MLCLEAFEEIGQRLAAQVLVAVLRAVGVLLLPQRLLLLVALYQIQVVLRARGK